MSIDPRQLSTLLDPVRGARRWLLGLSGGLDSVVLLHLLWQLRQQQQLPPLLAVHVNHQISPAADQWAEFVAELCSRLDIDLETRAVSVEKSAKGLEAAAREARYRVFESLLAPTDVVLLAHHLDDQVETFFLRLLRGAGTRGLSGMPRSRPLGVAELYRPLLDVPRNALEDYAQRQQLQWVEDDSNADTGLDRNYLRHEVLPLLQQRWPGYRASVSRGVTSVAEAEDLLQLRYVEQVAAASGTDYGEPTLELELLEDCSSAVASRLLRLWLQRNGLHGPGREQLLEFIEQLRSAPQQSPELRTSAYVLRRFRQRIYASAVAAQGAPPSLVGQSLLPDAGLTLPGVGKLELVPSEEGGLAGNWLDGLQLGFRGGGERCQPSGRDHSQTLKKLLQEYAVPPWWRDRVPLLVVGDALVAVADLWVCAGFEAKPGQGGYEVRWSRNPDGYSD